MTTSSKRKKTPLDYVKDCVDLEMKKYLSMPKIGRKEDPILWWKNDGQKQFPYLFSAAKRFQCINATSVPSERIFSRAGHVLNKKRSRLGRDVANMLITLNANMD